MSTTQQELNFIVILIVAIFGVGIPICIYCVAVLRANWCAAASSVHYTHDIEDVLLEARLINKNKNMIVPPQTQVTKVVKEKQEEQEDRQNWGNALYKLGQGITSTLAFNVNTRAEV